MRITPWLNPLRNRLHVWSCRRNHQKKRNSRFKTAPVELLEDRLLLTSDFGDLPFPYPTTLAENGAQHGAMGPTLGTHDGEVEDDLVTITPSAPTLDPEPLTTPGTDNTISWSPVSGADEYLAEYDDNSDFSSPEGNSGWVTDTQYGFTGLTQGKEYFYRVMARGITSAATDFWTQTTQAHWQDPDNVLVDVNAMASPGNLVLAGGNAGEIANVISNASFESVTASEPNEWLRHNDDGHVGTSTYFHGDGSYGVYSAAYDDPVAAGDWRGVSQLVDLSDISTLTFDRRLHTNSGTWTQVKARIWVDNDVLWEDYGDGDQFDIPLDVASYTGYHTLKLGLYFTGSNVGYEAVWFDDLRTYGSGYVAAGSIGSESIEPSSLGQWGELALGSTVPPNTSLAVDVLPASGTTPIPGYENVTNGADLSGITENEIRLRASLATTDPNVTPVLHDWSVTWTETVTVYHESPWSDIESSKQGDLDVDAVPFLHYEFENNGSNSGTFGASHDGTKRGDAGYSTDAIRGEYSINMGTDGYVAVPAVGFGDTATVATWVKGDFTGPVGNLARDGMNTVFSTRPSTSSPSGALMFVNNWNTQNGAVRFETGNASTYQGANTSAGVVQTDAWHHLALTINRPADTVEIYVDGTLEKTGTGSSFFENFTDNQAMYIGAPGTLMWWHFTGNIDDFRVYDTVLTEADIDDIIVGDSPVTVESFTPADDATDVPADTNLVLDFNENMQKGSGNIVIKQSSDDAVVETIAVTSSQVTISSDHVTIDPSSDFAESTEYYVLIDAGTFKDLGGSDFPGITDATTWSFTTGVNSQPGIEIEFSSSSGSFVVAPGGTLVVSVSVSSSPEALHGFQLNFSDSDIATGELRLHQWTTAAGWLQTLDGTLGAPTDTFVAAANLPDTLQAPVELGTFEIVIPDVTQDTDFLLTLNSLFDGAFQTAFIGSSGAIPIVDHGDLTIHVDATPPTVSGLTVSDLLIADADAGGTFTVTVDFSEVMDQMVPPTITFGEDVSGTLTFNAGTSDWTDDDTYVAVYDVLDANVDQRDITIDVSGAQDLAGNVQLDYLPESEVSIDTANPSVTSVTVGDLLIADADAGGTFTVTVDFSEVMDQMVPPAITFGEDVSGTLTFNADTSDWTDGDTYVAVYNVLDANVDQRDITIAVDGAQDPVGNAQLDYLPESEVSIDTANPTVVSIDINATLMDPPDLLDSGPQPTSWQQQRSDVRTIQVTFSEDVTVVAADLQLTNLGKNADEDADTIIPLTDSDLSFVGNVLTISFTASELMDGVYQLEVLPSVQDAATNPLDGNGDGTGGDSFVHTGDESNKFFKLAGDFNGDGGVSLFDFATFQYWFGTTVSPAPGYADLSQDGGVSIFDLPIFRGNFGPENSLVFPNAAAALKIGSATSSGFSETDDSPAFPTSHVTASVPDLTSLPRIGPMDHQAIENSPKMRPQVPDDSSRLDESLTEEALTAIVDAAITRWGEAGITAEDMSRLETVEFRIDDLGHELGRARSELVLIDDDGAGYGWFIDTTPHDDREFDDRGRAFHESSACGRSDLLTVVMHELGHVLGLEHMDEDQDPDGFMRETLDISTRRLPLSTDAPSEPAAIDRFFGTVFEAEESFLPFDG